MTTLGAAITPYIPGQNQHRTEHILVVTFISILPSSPPHQGKSDFSETHFIQFCTYGNIGPNPTHLSMYHSEENKAPYIHSKKKKKTTKCLASLVAQSVKNPPAMWETWVQSLGWEDPLEKGTAIHSSILAWKIPMDRGAWWATVHGVAKSGT